MSQNGSDPEYHKTLNDSDTGDNLARVATKREREHEDCTTADWVR